MSDQAVRELLALWRNRAQSMTALANAMEGAGVVAIAAALRAGADVWRLAVDELTAKAGDA